MPSLLRYNTFGIDAQCNKFIEYASVEELQSYINDGLSEEYNVLHIGGGSNILFTTPIFNGTVIHSAIKGREIISEDKNFSIVRAGASEVWDEFVEWTLNHNLYGLENLSLIPGEVGASAVQNIGAYGSEAGKFIHKVYMIDLKTGKSHSIDGRDCRFGYRDSIYKNEYKGRFAITYVEYRLSKHFVPQYSHAAVTKALESTGIDTHKATAKDIRRAIIAVRESKLPNPKEIGSAGSFFMNPVVSTQKAEELLAQYPQMPHYPTPEGVKIPAGWLIEQCGWKGKRLGRAGVYEKQALILINLGGATGADIVTLSDTIRRDVTDNFGITIRPEAIFV